MVEHGDALQEDLAIGLVEELHDPAVAPHGVVHAAERNEIVEGAGGEGCAHQFHLILHLIDTSPADIDAMLDEVNVGLVDALGKRADIAFGVDVNKELRAVGQTVDKPLQVDRVFMCGDKKCEFCHIVIIVCLLLII